MVQAIDFLPLSYKYDRQRDRKKLARRIALAVFLALIVAGTYQQRRIQRQLQTRRDQLQAQATRLINQLENPDAIRDQICKLDIEANLIAVLRMGIPPTRMLASLTNCRPKYVSLVRCDISVKRTHGPSAGKAATDADPNAAKQKSPEERDLQQLCEETKQSALFVSLEGLAPDDLAISAYLAALEKTGLFDHVQLLYSDTTDYGENVMRSFEVNLRIKNPSALEPPKRDPAPRVVATKTRVAKQSGNDPES